MKALLRRVRQRLARRERDAAGDPRAARLAQEEAERRRDETYARISRPPDASGGGPFIGL